MFDNVPRATYEQERDRRVAAETRAEASTVLIKVLTDQLKQKDEQIKEQRQTHHVQHMDMMNRYEPLPGTPRLPSEVQLKSMTAAQIRQQPAATRQEMLRRERMAVEAEKREAEDSRNASIARATQALDISSLPASEAEALRIATTLQ